VTGTVSAAQAAEMVADVLAMYPDCRFKRRDLIRACLYRGHLSISGLGWLTEYWPLIERAVLDNHNLYAFRPNGRWDYTVGATHDPVWPMMTLNRRESEVITRMSRDIEGGNLGALALSDVQMALLKARYDAHLAAAGNLDQQMESLIANLTMLPYAPASALRP
jgi:hypothetical protein